MSRELPILFSGTMVLASLADLETQMRRLVTPQPPASTHIAVAESNGGPTGRWLFGTVGDAIHGAAGAAGPVHSRACPWQPGDRLWVRETWQYNPYGGIVYRAGSGIVDCAGRGWRPSVHMPRRASRLTLEVLAVRAERLQDITEADAAAEGISRPHAAYSDVDYYQAWVGGKCVTNESARFVYRALWDSVHAASGHGWDLNEWVWVVTFRRMP